VERIAGQGLIRVEVTKTAAGRRRLALPSFAVDALRQRRSLPFLGEHPVILFPSTAGTWRDPNNFGREWRIVRGELGVPDVTTHSFRKTLVTLIDDRGLSGRGRPLRALKGQHDAGRLHDAWQSAFAGNRPARRCNKRRINVAPEPVRLQK
jgi:integrase